MFSRLNTLLLPSLATVSLLLSSGCGGTTTSYPGPEPITLIVEEPGEGVVLKTAAFTARGQVSKADALVACQGRPVTLDAQGRFTAPITLQEGSNDVLFQAWRAADVGTGLGSSHLPPQAKVAATVTRRVRFERPALLLNVARPQEGEAFGVSHIAVQGVVSEPEATVDLNGTSLTVDSHGAFQGVATLAEGGNILVFTAKAIGNRSVVVNRNVTFHAGGTGAVDIRITSPAEGMLTNAPSLEVRGTVSPTNLTATLNGQVVSVAADGIWSQRLTLAEGAQILTAQAADAMGNTGQDQRNITVDRTPPLITLARPVPALVNQPTLALEGLVDDPTAILTLQGQGLVLDPQGRFTASYGLSQGANTLSFRAVDPAGNVGTLSVGTVLDNIAPVVILENPVEGLVTNAHEIPISGRVDDSTARVLVAGNAVTLSSDGHFETMLRPATEGSQLIVALATDPAGNTGHATRGIRLDWTPPQLAWKTPTPAEGALVAHPDVDVAASISEQATVSLNGQSLAIRDTGSYTVTGASPLEVQTRLSLSEGEVSMVLSARDEAGNESQISRRFQVGLTRPVIQLQQPTFDAQQRFLTREANVLVIGRVVAPNFVEPISLKVNGTEVPLDASGAFQLPLSLIEGQNPLKLLAVNRFGQDNLANYEIRRHTTPFGIELTWPLNGMALPGNSTEVRGRVLREGTTVTVNGLPAVVDTLLNFSAQVPLVAGENILRAEGRDALDNQGSAQVKVVSAPPQSASYHWDLPAVNQRTSLRTIHVRGQADLPGIASVTVNGQSMSLNGVGKTGQFEGDLRLLQTGRNTLVLEARSVAGERMQETRDVILSPDLPRIRLMAPEAARPGTSIPIQVLPELGTKLVKAELSFNGRSLATVEAPFPAKEALIAADAAPGTRMLVEAIGTDVEGETVSARTYVQIYANGALLQPVFNDRNGLPLEGATVALDGAERVATDARGRASLQTALPTQWVKVSKPSFAPVWRAASLKIAGLESLPTARLTPLAESVEWDGAAKDFASGSLRLSFAPPSGTIRASITPLSGQGLPGLLPLGWSPVSAWWIEGEGSGSAALNIIQGLPVDIRLVWARWDELTHAWICLDSSRLARNLEGLPVPQGGGYALLAPDPAPTAPPEAIQGQPLLGSESFWREDLKAYSGEGPQIMSTVEAIRGARIEAYLHLGFDGKAPVPSSTLIQTEQMESYTLLDQRLIEPESFQGHAWGARWSLAVHGGLPVVTGAGDGLLLHLPVHMSRDFIETELVEGRVLVGFFKESTNLTATGTALLGSTGGSVSQGGLTATLSAGATAGQVLLRVSPDTGNLESLWPEAASAGVIKASFQVDVVGSISKGIGLHLDALDLSVDAVPLLVQRRVVQGERVVVAAGELRKTATGWDYLCPEGAPELLDGGAFAVISLPAPFVWVSGTAYAPPALIARKALQNRTSARVEGDLTLPDALINLDLLPAISGPSGTFAVPATASKNPVTLRGERRDLALVGTSTTLAPAVAVELRMATQPFRIAQVLPQESAEVGPGDVLQVFTNVPMNEATVGQVRLFREAAPSAPVEISLRRSLSLDGKSLSLVPEQALEQGAPYLLKIEGLQSVVGETASTFARHFHTATLSPDLGVDLSRISLSYPTEAFDVTVNVPMGAVPPWSLVTVEAPQMGSFGQGVMPPERALTFPLKANLGERLTVMIQLRDGRSFSGTIGRYVAEDGRTTLGKDGGRVEGPGGIALVVPVDALDGPSELRVAPSSEIPQPAEGALHSGEQMLPALEIRSKDPIQFRKPPILELPVGAVPQGVVTKMTDATLTYGNGPVALYQKISTTLPDGTEDFSYVLVDTAQQSSDGVLLRSLGGLHVPDPVNGTSLLAQPVKLAKAMPTAQPNLKLSNPKMPTAKTGAGTDPRISYGYEPYYLGFFVLYTPVVQYEPEYLYHSGTVYRNWNGLGTCGGNASVGCYGYLPGAEVHRYNGSTGVDAARRGRLARGRMLATCDDQGRYLSVGGPLASAVPGQNWISLFAVDPRTGETSLDPGAVGPTSLGLPYTRREHSLVITSTGGNPFDPALTAPRLRAMLLDASGLARTIFTIGESATLRISTENGSQPVVRGKISGSITQDFGVVPADIPVTFTQEGTWKTDILGWTAKPVQGATSLSVIVTPVGVLGPSKLGKPAILAKDPGEGEKDIDPSAIIKITFTEPVHGATVNAFSLKVNQLDVPFRVVSNAREVADGTTRVQEVWLMPNQRLSLGAAVVVGASSFIVDQEGESLDNLSWTFTIRGADEVGVLAGAGTYSEMVVHKGTLYAVEKIRESVASDYGFDIAGAPIQTIRMIDVSDPSSPKLGPSFGAHGSWEPMGHGSMNYAGGEPFHKHEIHGIRVAPGMGINGQSRDLLMVTTRPRMVTEMYVWSSDGENSYRSRHNVIWVFDITGDTPSFGENRTPKLLMCSSLGTLSDTWAKGLGSAGGVLGTIRLRGGLTLWNAEAWWNSFMEDANALSVQSLARRTRMDTGYFPSSTAVVAANGFYNPASEVKPSVTSAVITEDANGRPIGFATMGYSDGLLTFIDGKVGDPLATATFTSGGPKGMDGRIHDLSTAVNREPANLVEVLKGTWQGNNGTEQGTLLLAATAVADKAHFWVLKPDLTNPNDPGAAQLALAELPGRISRIQVDPPKMLVGVQAGSKVYVFDLKTFQMASNSGPMALTPIFEFEASGAWTMADGLLFDDQMAWKKLVVNNLDSVTITPKLGIPLLVDVNQFFAGAFYEYNRSVLGPYNPPSMPQMPEKLVYALTDLQGKNGGNPMLRHYYPDLGEMHISGVVNLADPNKFLEATTPGSPWIMEAKAKLYDGAREIPGAVAIEGLTISGDQRVAAGNGSQQSKIYGNGDRAKEELTPNYKDKDENIAYPSRQQKFAYAPFKFFIKPETLQSLDQDLRLDFKERFRVKVELKLYKNERQRVSGPPEATLQTFEFSVKFNSNTRVFDVVRGGAWYFDPNVAGDDPSNTAKNLNAETWYQMLVNRSTLSKDQVMTAFKSRISMSEIQDITPEQAGMINGSRAAVQTLPFHEMGLDVVQGAMDCALVGLRRQVFQEGQVWQSMPLPVPYRATLLRPADQAFTAQNLEGDIPGGFGYRTAHALNAMQEFRVGEADAAKTLDTPRLWSKDPGTTSSEVVRETDSRIMPVIHQLLKKRDGSFNEYNMLVRYWAAYPRMRQVPEETQKKGLFPINTILTRDLLLGPTPEWSDPSVQAWSEKEAVDGRTYRKQREDLEVEIRRVDALPALSAPAHDMAKVEESFGSLLQQVLGQDIIIDRGSPWTPGVGRFFNEGIGLLQLGLQTNWRKRRMDVGQETGFVPNTNPRVCVVNETVPPVSTELLSDKPEFWKIYRKVSEFFLNHPKARRLAVYINGVANLGVEIDESADRLQRKLLADLYPDPAQREDHLDEALVIGVYNRSSKLFYGGIDSKINVFDIQECLAMKADTANPGTTTDNADAIRLMMTLKAVAKALHEDLSFRESYLAVNAPLGPTEASARLAELRATLTLHAHSQGAIAAAVAQSRLGTMASFEPVSGGAFSSVKPVPAFFHLVTYGGGANMHDFLEVPYYSSYTHHVNEKDLVAFAFGMHDPLQRAMTLILRRQLLALPGPYQIGKAALILGYPHTRRLVKGPSQELIESLNTHHNLIRFLSHCGSFNFAEHNFLNGYLCKVGLDPKSLLFKEMGEYKARDGGDYCLLPSPLDNPKDYKDCNR